MKISKGTLIAIVVLIVWLILSWMLGTWLHLKSPNLWLLRGGLALIGIIGFVGYLLVIRSSKPKAPASQSNGGGVAQDIDLVFAEAANRLRSSNLAHAKGVAALPAIFILGDSNTAKTSVLAHSGLEAELLAGQAYQDNLVTPTKVVNLWFARRIVFVDPAGRIVADPAARRKLFHKFAPVGVGSVLGGAAPPARAVVVTLDCESFLAQGGAEAIAGKARQLQATLGELAQELGTSFPVYVLFTKADRLPYFREYVENLTEPEAGEIFGVTIPLEAPRAGVYAEEQTRRLTEAFQNLYYSLADKRSVLLAREHESPKLPNIYEFPREFGKLRPFLVQFLVDLCRPSQLQTNPFLRGFYFTGVRPVVISDLAPAAVQQVQPEPAGFDAGATRIFSRRQQTSAPLVEAQQGGSRKVPQWVFLNHLFGDLILADRSALGLTQKSVKVSFWRRALMAAAAALALFLAAAWTISYIGNRSLVNEAEEAAQTMPPQQLASTQLASLDSLQRLERVRVTLERLNKSEREGAPWHLRWGLYSGTAIRGPLRQVYYALFRRLLLAPTQDTLIAVCSNPPQSDEISNYSFVYNALKAYLITTKNHEKSTRDFLAPVLMQHWLNSRPIDNERSNLAQKQFDFYADDLVESNPYARYVKPNDNAVSTARVFLNKFKYEQRVYQVMLADASKQNPAIVFNKLFPGSAEVVANNYRVEGGFTKGGFAAFQKELQDPDKYFSGEAWVLGPTSNAAENKADLARKIQQLYTDEFVKAWRAYIKATSVLGYHNVPDAANKLSQMVGNQSPLLAVLCVASENTAVSQKSISDLFQPPQIVTPPGCLNKLSSQANGAYMDGLTRLQTSVNQVAQNPANEPAKAQSLSDAATAQATASGISRNFPVDSAGGVDTKTTEILMAPIKSIPALVGGLDKAAVNGQAKQVCDAFQSMLSKYPFNTRSTTDATIPEVITFLKQPDGTLWSVYNGPTFQKLMVKQGGTYMRVEGQSMSISNSFLAWVNRAAAVSDAFFKNGAQNPSFTFAIKPAPSEDVESIKLEIDGQSYTYPKGGGSFQQFQWPGGVQNVKLQAQFVGGTAFNFPTGIGGTWAVFRWLDSVEHLQQQGSTYTFEATLRTTAGVATIPSNGHPATVKLILDPMGSPIRPGFFSGLNPCARVAVQ